MRNRAAEFADSIRLLDGRLVSVRRLDADDADAVLRLHENLGDRDRYLRFFTLHPCHLDQLVRELTKRGDRQTAIGAYSGHAIARKSAPRTIRSCSTTVYRSQTNPISERAVM